jgi:hypothetical protein
MAARGGAMMPAWAGRLDQRAIGHPAFCRAIRDIAEVAAKAKALAAGNKLLLAGEMLSRLNYDRAPAAAIALTRGCWSRSAFICWLGQQRKPTSQDPGASGWSPTFSTGRSRFRQRQTTFCGFRKSPARESAREGSRGKVGFEDGAGAAPDFHKSAAPHFGHPVLTK